MNDKVQATMHFDLKESITFNKKDSDLVDSFKAQIKFAKNHQPSHEDVSLIMCILKWCVICEQKGTPLKTKNEAKEFLHGWIDEL